MLNGFIEFEPILGLYCLFLAVADVRVSLGGVYASNQAPYDALLQWRQALELYRELQIDDKAEFVEKLLRTSGRM